MKAIVMAGGEGTRLRPLTEEQPKPMVSVLDLPVIHRVAENLRDHGFEDICFTLKYMPGAVTAYFDSHPIPGIRTSYSIEEKPLGTAGGVKACADFIGGDDFLVISGDGICDLDLKAAAEFHYEKKAEVTVILYKHSSPTEYGLAVTDSDGRITDFSEKPSWDSVYTDTVNTGIYMISNKILDKIPENTFFDFSRDLFPLLLREKRRIYGFEGDGYWCDIGSAAAYAQCCKDLINGKAKLPIPAPETGKSVFSASPIPPSALVYGPVYIGRGVFIGEKTVLGPDCIIESGSRIEEETEVRNSVINGAVVRAGSRLTGAIVGKGAVLGENCIVEDGAVIAGNSVFGAGCFIASGAGIWPHRDVPKGTVIRGNLASGNPLGPLRFEPGGVIKGDFNGTITPENCFAIGASLADFGTVAVSCNGGEAAGLLADALVCGIRSAGGKAAVLGEAHRLAAFFCCSYLSFDGAVTAEQSESGITLAFAGKNGRPLGRAEERRIEAATGGELRRVGSPEVGVTVTTGNLDDAYIAAAVRCGRDVYSGSVGLRVHAEGNGAASRALRRALAAFGCAVVDQPQNAPSFFISPGGDKLSCRDEQGRLLSYGHVYTALACAELRSGCRTLAVSRETPAVLDELAAKHGAVLFRAQRDGDRVYDVLDLQPHMKDGIFAAVRLCAHMMKSSKTLQDLAEAAPDVAVTNREVPLSGGRAEAMRELSAYGSRRGREPAGGITMRTGDGWINITPSVRRSALIIRTEAACAETAEDISESMCRLIKLLNL